MTTEEKMMMQPTQEYIRKLQKKHSKPLPLQLERRPRRDALSGVDSEGARVYQKLDSRKRT